MKNKKVISLALTFAIGFGANYIPLYSNNIFAKTNIETGCFEVNISGEYNYDYANEVFNLINTERKKVGKNELKLDEELFNDANIRAAEIALYYSHTRTNDSECSTIVYSSPVMGENIAAAFNSPESVMEAWMNSQGHKENILYTDFTNVGVGCFKCNGQYYWVQLFSGGHWSESDDIIIDTSTYTGKESKTVTIDASGTNIFSKTTISGLANDLTLNKGDITKASEIKVTNIGFEFTSVYINASDIDWYSSDESVITVSEDGTLTAVGGGNATVTAYAGGDYIKEYQITSLVPLENISIEEEKDIYIKNNYKLEVSFNPEDTTDDKTIVWSSSNKSVATVDENGIVTPHSIGTATITAKATNGMKAYCTVNIVDYIPGDLTEDGVVNANDAAKALDLYKYNNATERDILIGDIDKNGAINANDSALILDIYKYGK